MKPDTRRRPDAPIDLPRIPGYRIEGILGRGTSGVVYSAVQEVIDRAVALKILRGDLAQSTRAVERFRREARTAARLAHPAIIAPIDMGQLPDGRWWYAMELVEGISLAERIDERGPLSERDALRMFLPLADALQHLHEVGVVHRDVKPANILIDPRERALLADLGLAFARDEPSLTGSGGVLGTPHYVSPEQARDSSKVDARSDIWSLGATLYHAVTGRPPFSGNSVAEVFSAVLQDPLVDPRRFAPDLSSSFVLVLRACLTRDLDHRYQEPKDLKADLQRLLERRPPQVNKEGLEPLAHARSMAPWQWGLGLAVVLGLSLLAWAPWEAGQGKDPRSGPREGPLAPLEALESNYREGRHLPIAVLDRLAGWPMPETAAEAAQVRQRIQTLNIQVLGDMAVFLRGLVQEFDPAIELTMKAGSWTEAQRLLEQELPRRLMLGLGRPRLEDLPDVQEVGGFRQWYRTQEASLEAERIRRLDQVSREARLWLQDEVDPAVQHALLRNDFQTALDQCPDRLEAPLERFRGTWTGLPREMVDAQLQRDLLPGLLALRQSVRQAWTVLESQLMAWIEAQEPDLMAKIETNHVEGMDAELQAGFEQRLAVLELDMTEVPEVWAQTVGTALDQASLRLRREGQRQRLAVARNEYERDSADGEKLLQRRQYGAACQLWQDRLDSPWRVSVFPEMQRELREGQLLQELLHRCGQRLQQLAGSECTLTLHGVPRRGQILVGADVVQDGVTLISNGGRDRDSMALRHPIDGPEAVEVLVADDVLRFADEFSGDLSDASSQASSDYALARAVFLFHEGFPREALNALPRGLAETDPLVDSLHDRILRDLTRGEGLSPEELVVDIAALIRDVEGGGQARARWRSEIEALLLEPDLTPEQRTQLLELQARVAVEGSRRTLAMLYPDAEILSRGPELASRRDVELRWRFDRNPDSWSLGTFQVEPGRLRNSPSGADSAPDWWTQPLSLPLASPLELARPMRFALTFRIPEGQPVGPVMLNVGGYYLAFLTAGDQSRFAGGEGTPRSLLESLELGGVSGYEGFSGFEPGKYHRLEIELSTLASTRRGRIKAIRLDGRELKGPTFVPRPATTPVVSLAAQGALDLYSFELGASEALPR
ncbi:MAG: serine/threonine protein kinase [Planctomycetes bacterium]|nr:serine/threonine protein kinase [Planctomycetota bacterium]